MFAMPNAVQLVELAASLNLHLSHGEAELYLPFIVDAMRELDAFVQSRADEAAPPLLFPERAPGYRPSLTEDRYLTWLWKCAIGGEDRGLLAGRTVSFKDHISVAGIPQVFTSQVLESFIPDATVVSRVLEAGGKVVGKHMMNGFMGDYGKPLNPHNLERITGGSSSGSGAALAAGEVDISFGGDQGGSIRLPAAYCGVVGLKPTFGLVSHFAVGFAFEPSVDHVGPMARTVPDVAAALQAVAGYDDYDPRQRRGIPERMDALSDLDGGVRGLRIGILEEGFAEPIEPDVAAGVLAAVSTLEELGAEVTRISVPQHAQIDSVYAALVFEGARAIYDVGFFGTGAKTYYPASIITAIDRMWRTHSDMMQPRTKLSHLIAELSRRNYHGGVYAKAHNVRPSYVAAFDRVLAKVDVLALPTVRNIAPRAQAARVWWVIAPSSATATRPCTISSAVTIRVASSAAALGEQFLRSDRDSKAANWKTPKRWQRMKARARRNSTIAPAIRSRSMRSNGYQSDASGSGADVQRRWAPTTLRSFRSLRARRPLP